MLHKLYISRNVPGHVSISNFQAYSDVVFGSPVSGLQKDWDQTRPDWKKTGLSPGLVFFKIEDCKKTGRLDQSGPVWTGLLYPLITSLSLAKEHVNL